MTETNILTPSTVLSYFRLNVSSYITWAQATAKDFSVRNELYHIGQFARHLGPDHTRVASSEPLNGVNNVVFKDKSHRYVAVLANDNATDSTARVVLSGKSFVVKGPAKPFATYQWNGRHH